MHFFKNSVSFIAIMCVYGAAYSAAPRVGMIGTAGSARRVSSIASVVQSTGARTAVTSLADTASDTTSDTSSSVSALSDTDCVDNYRECMKGDNACGSDFSECTTNVLFHGHMSECFSTLAQCSASGIESLFGTSDITALSEVSSYVDGTNDGEVSRYTYPTDGSVMGMDIIGAATRNKLSTSDCVKKYKKCLNKDDVCGEDFELCTGNDAFKKQAALCDSTLSRCQKEGFQQLFGDDVTTKPSLRKLQPKQDGIITQWITDGATLAASNAVNTCYKVVDNCFLSACAKNPYRCVEGVSFNVINAAGAAKGETMTASSDPAAKGMGMNGVSKYNSSESLADVLTSSSVRKFLRSACLDTIGANQYCFMTFRGKAPSKTELTDPDEREDIFDEAYSTRNKKEILGAKISGIVEEFDKDAKSKCVETFKSCAIRSCGGGSGAACYTKVFGTNAATNGATGSIASKAYNDVEKGCKGVVNMDANCIYMAATQGGDAYNSTFADNSAFNNLFPKNGKSVIIDALDSDLSISYNAAAIQQMKKQCSNVVTNCVKSMCGKDYQNCYRNRNDMYVKTYSTAKKDFNASMNKVGGVLDYTIVQGLCVQTVKNSNACEESLAIAKMNVRDSAGDVIGGWGTTVDGDATISSTWRKSADNYNVSTGQVQKTDDQGRKLCVCENGDEAVCDTEEGGVSGCTNASMASVDYVIETKATNNLFQEVLADIEANAQAVYNAKLTKEQNVCLAQNSASNLDSTFVWAKLPGKRTLPSDYAAKGLGKNGSVASNDLYNSFCRVRVTLMSEDKDVQTLLSGGSIKVDAIQNDGIFGIDFMAKDTKYGTLTGGGEANAYFATGDAFTCGSWITETTLDAISKKIDHDARVAAGQGSQHDKNVKLWTTIAGGAVGGVGGFAIMDNLQRNGKSLGGLLSTSSEAEKPTAEDKKSAKKCLDDVADARTKLSNISTAAGLTAFQNAANKALSSARAAGVKNEDLTNINFPGSTTGSGLSWNLTQKQIISDNYSICLASTKKIDGDDAEKQSNKTSAAEKVIKYIGSDAPAKDWQSDSELMTASAVLTTSALKGCESMSLGDVVVRGTSTDNSSTYSTHLETLYTKCSEIADGDEDDDARKKRRNNNLWAAGVGALGTSVLANGIVSSVQKAHYESAANSAVQEWMDNIGSKIHCYVNGQHVADFGDIVTIDISEE